MTSQRRAFKRAVNNLMAGCSLVFLAACSSVGLDESAPHAELPTNTAPERKGLSAEAIIQVWAIKSPVHALAELSRAQQLKTMPPEAASVLKNKIVERIADALAQNDDAGLRTQTANSVLLNDRAYASLLDHEKGEEIVAAAYRHAEPAARRSIYAQTLTAMPHTRAGRLIYEDIADGLTPWPPQQGLSVLEDKALSDLKPALMDRAMESGNIEFIEKLAENTGFASGIGQENCITLIKAGASKDPVAVYGLYPNLAGKCPGIDAARIVQMVADAVNGQEEVLITPALNDLHSYPDPVRFRILPLLSDGAILQEAHGKGFYTSTYNRLFPEVRRVLGENPDLRKRVFDESNQRLGDFVVNAYEYMKLDELVPLLRDDEIVTAHGKMLEALARGYPPPTEDDMTLPERDPAYTTLMAAAMIETMRLSATRPAAGRMQERLESAFRTAKQEGDIPSAVRIGMIAAQHAKTTPSGTQTPFVRGAANVPEYALEFPQKLPLADLRSPQGNVYAMMTFFNDEAEDDYDGAGNDGLESYRHFLGTWRGAAGWSLDDHGAFVSLSHQGGKVHILANKPEYAGAGNQAALGWIEAREPGASPSIIVGRGHSYYIQETAQYITERVRLAFLGACYVGSEELKSLQSLSPGLQMPRTGNIGTMKVNDPALRIIMQELAEGRDIVWPVIRRKLVQNVRDGRVENYFLPNEDVLKALRTRNEAAVDAPDAPDPLEAGRPQIPDPSAAPAPGLT